MRMASVAKRQVEALELEIGEGIMKREEAAAAHPTSVAVTNSQSKPSESDAKVDPMAPRVLENFAKYAPLPTVRQLSPSRLSCQGVGVSGLKSSADSHALP